MRSQRSRARRGQMSPFSRNPGAIFAVVMRQGCQRGAAWCARFGICLLVVACNSRVPDDLMGALQTNLSATQSEDLDAVIGTMDPSCEGFAQLPRLLRQVFSIYDLRYEIEKVALIDQSEHEASLEVTIVTRKVSGPAFRDNRVTAVNHLTNRGNGWKICQTDQKNVEYLPSPPADTPEDVVAPLAPQVDYLKDVPLDVALLGKRFKRVSRARPLMNRTPSSRKKASRGYREELPDSVGFNFATFVFKRGKLNVISMGIRSREHYPPILAALKALHGEPEYFEDVPSVGTGYKWTLTSGALIVIQEEKGLCGLYAPSLAYLF